MQTRERKIAVQGLHNTVAVRYSHLFFLLTLLDLF
jgi:hypothetical protein